MTHDALFAISFFLSLLLAFSAGYIAAMASVARQRAQMIEAAKTATLALIEKATSSRSTSKKKGT